MTSTQWAIISSYGSRIRTAGEQLESCAIPPNDLGIELEVVEHAVRKIREGLRAIHELPPLALSIRINWEMLDNALDKAISPVSGGVDREELKKELFG